MHTISKRILPALLSGALTLTIGAQTDTTPAAANLLRNGSFENPKSTWIDTTCNYMSLTAGSTALSGWKVTSDTINEVVWAMTPTCDGRTAARGTFFLDLTGFGADSPNGGVQQTLKNLTPGQAYIFSMDVESDGILPLVSVGNSTVSLTAGTPFTKGGDTWTPERGTFTAESASALLIIQNQGAGQQINFIDNIVVRER